MHDLHIPLHELPLNEIRMVTNVEYMATPNGDPTLVLVLGDDTEEVKIYKRTNGKPISKPSVTSVARRKSSNSAKRVSRLGITVNRPEPANSLVYLKNRWEMTWDEFFKHLLEVHYLYHGPNWKPGSKQKQH